MRPGKGLTVNEPIPETRPITCFPSDQLVCAHTRFDIDYFDKLTGENN